MDFLALYRKILPTLPQGSAVLSMACGPAKLACPGRLLGTWNLVSTADPLTQNLQIPGESCSHYSFRSAGLEALLGSSCGCTLPQMQAAREDQGVWSPGAPPPPGPALSTQTLELLPEPLLESTGLFIKNLNSQAPLIRSLGLVPRTLHSDPFPFDF